MLRIRGLVAGYEDAGSVLEGIDLEVAAGESVALMGRNGMGKTTLLRAIMGLLRPTAGEVVLDGVALTGRPPFEISNAGIAYVPQGREIFRDFTVEENLRLGLLGKHGMATRVPDAIYARFPILAERRWQRAETMSGGEQQQLAIARAVVGRPRLLLLDEPSEGIQPSLVESIATTVSAISREDGPSVLLVEQNLDLVLALTTRWLFINSGRIVAETACARLPTVVILGTLYPVYRLFIMAVAVLAAAGTFLLFYRTSLGLVARAVIANRPMASSLGLNTRRMDRMTFAFGAALAGLAGAVMAPLMSVDPQMGVGFLIPAFLSILVGGTGTLLGTLLGTTLIAGASTVVASVWTQITAQIVVFALAIVVIRLFPQGITGARR